MEEHYADDADKVISVFHFSKEVQRTHGVPFKFVVKPVSSRILRREGNKLNPNQGERFADTKKRLQARIGASDKDFARFRFALIQAVTFKQPSYIEDGELITPKCSDRESLNFSRRQHLRAQVRTRRCSGVRSCGQIWEDADWHGRESNCDSRVRGLGVLFPLLCFLQRPLPWTLF